MSTALRLATSDLSLSLSRIRAEVFLVRDSIWTSRSSETLFQQKRIPASIFSFRLTSTKSELCTSILPFSLGDRVGAFVELEPRRNETKQKLIRRVFPLSHPFFRPRRNQLSSLLRSNYLHGCHSAGLLDCCFGRSKRLFILPLVFVGLLEVSTLTSPLSLTLHLFHLAVGSKSITIKAGDSVIDTGTTLVCESFLVSGSSCSLPR